MTDLDKVLRLAVSACGRTKPDWAVIIGVFSDSDEFILVSTLLREIYYANKKDILSEARLNFKGEFPNVKPSFSMSFIVNKNSWNKGVDGITTAIMHCFATQRSSPKGNKRHVDCII